MLPSKWNCRGRQVLKRLTITKIQPTDMDFFSVQSAGQTNMRQYILCILVWKINTSILPKIKFWKYICLHENIFPHYMKPTCSLSGPFFCIFKFPLHASSDITMKLHHENINVYYIENTVKSSHKLQFPILWESETICNLTIGKH